MTYTALMNGNITRVKQNEKFVQWDKGWFEA